LIILIGLLACSGCGRVPVTPFGAALDATPREATPSSGTNVRLPSNAAVRTADEAARIALSQAPTVFYATHPHVASVQLVMPFDAPVPTDRYVPAKQGDDPERMSWLVTFDQGGYSMEACPIPPPGFDQTTCWQGPTASMTISVMTGDVGMISAPYPRDRGTPYGSTIGITGPAKLKTRQEAMDAGFANVRAQDGKRPTIISVRLLSLTEWLAEQDQRGVRPNVDGLDPATPIWELEFTGAVFPLPCHATCDVDHLILSLNALTGESLLVAGAPPPASPSATPIATP